MTISRIWTILYTGPAAPCGHICECYTKNGKVVCYEVYASEESAISAANELNQQYGATSCYTAIPLPIDIEPIGEPK